MKIIGISEVQGIIDWSRVRDADGTVIRFSRGADEDCICGISPEMDERAERNLRGAYQARIAAGVSHVLGGTTVSEVRAEAAWFLDALKGYRAYLTLPVVVVSLGEFGIAEKFRSLSPSHIGTLVKTFCQAVTRAGLTPLLSADAETLSLYIDRRKLGRLGLWYVRPFVSEDCALYEEADMCFWQYSTETSPRNSGIYADYPVSRVENFCFEPLFPRVRRMTCRLYA